MTVGVDASTAIAFLDGVAERVAGENRAAYVMATMESAHYKLMRLRMDEVKSAMDTCEKHLESLASVDISINAAFYRVAADYYKVSGDLQHFMDLLCVVVGSCGLRSILQTRAPLPRLCLDGESGCGGESVASA